jgi:hypothetical protein
MSSEKRRDPRFESRQKLWCEGQPDLGQARNMSRSGMFIVADQKREVGEQFKVAFEGEEGQVELNMEVMWAGQTPDSGGQVGMGLRIVSFGKGEDAYQRFVQDQLKAEGLDGGEEPSGEPEKK